MFTTSEKQFILSLARQTITQFLETKIKLEIETDEVPTNMREVRSCFVTLTEDFELRGCVGHVEASQPLYKDIIDNAIAAATEDSRFNSVTKDEIPQIQIEVSVLTKPEKLDFSSPQDLLDKLRVGVDGVILNFGKNSATFLPQVWDELLNKKEFLASLCVKAGLPPGRWMNPDIAVETYQVEIVSE